MDQFENVTVIKKANIFLTAKYQAEHCYFQTAQKKHLGSSCPVSMSLAPVIKKLWRFLQDLLKFFFQMITEYDV